MKLFLDQVHYSIVTIYSGFCNLTPHRIQNLNFVHKWREKTNVMLDLGRCMPGVVKCNLFSKKNSFFFDGSPNSNTTNSNFTRVSSYLSST